MKYIFLFFIFLAGFVVSNAQQPVDPVYVEDVYFAKDDGTGQAGKPSKEFFASDIPIFCVVVLNTAKETTVKMNLVVVKVEGVKPESKVVSAVYKLKNDQNRVNFTGSPHKTWLPGVYRADIFLDGKLTEGLEFEVLPNGSKKVSQVVDK